MLKGKAFKFGDNISTDHIVPGRLAHLRSDLPKLAQHVLEDADPTFALRVKPGDFVVGGSNFGLGSSAVLAKSVARIFFRNSINRGLPVLICDTDKIHDGDELEVDMAAGTIHDITSNITLSFKPIPRAMLAILEEGGLIPYIQKYGDFKLA
jgi:3-isopropylmalate/(R)-2-methylmalate dehydratase small subunit